jgi:hypothetical protein
VSRRDGELDPRLWIDWDRILWEDPRRRRSLTGELARRLVVAIAVLGYLAAVAGAAYLIASVVW